MDGLLNATQHGDEGSNVAVVPPGERPHSRARVGHSFALVAAKGFDPPDHILQDYRDAANGDPL